ncbi:hypothetical protein PVAP13_J683377 [Panicum virgatum]|nr:hypothetical protein PVAP13_J683377 [Panicum virgatum]
MLQNAVESTDLSKLSSLSKDDSWTVFTQIIGEDIKGLDSELLEVGREIVNKCGGVPLAIKVLANVLRGKTRIEQWKAVRDSNLLDAEDKEHRVLASLMLSYSHLPSHLKRAHNVISLTHGYNCLEDVGDECFNSLVQVSFLQDVKEYFGRVCCEMHDLLHDLAKFILDEQISTNVPKDNALGELRYLQELNILNCCRLSSLPQAMGQLTSLQVLRIGTCDGLKQLPECLGELCSLRTLHVEWLPKIKSLPQLLQHQHITSLEDLRIHACHALHELPEWLGYLCALCKLHISGLDGLACFPESMCRLTSLKELYIDSCPRITSFPQGIKGFTALKKLEIIDCQGIKSLP